MVSFTTDIISKSLTSLKNLTIILFCCCSISLNAQLFVVPKAKEPVEVDAQISVGEWEDAITNSKISNVIDEHGTIDGVEDLSGSVSFKWDETYLYFLFQITDDVRSLDSTDGNPLQLNTWEDDSIEIYLDINNTKTGGLDRSAKRYQYRFIPDAEGEIERFPDSLPTDGFQLATVGDSSYILEIAMPWDTLRLENPKEGHVLGFDVALNDDDDGQSRDGQITWYATESDDWEDPSTWGSILLAAPIDEIDNPTIEDLPAMQILHVGTQTWIGWNEIEEFQYQLRRSNNLNIWQNDGRELLSTGNFRYFIIPTDLTEDTFFQLRVTAP